MIAGNNTDSFPNGGNESQLTKPDAVSTVPSTIRGDWVLFHPVYTQEELKAVEVCLARLLSFL